MGNYRWSLGLFCEHGIDIHVSVHVYLRNACDKVVEHWKMFETTEEADIFVSQYIKKITILSNSFTAKKIFQKKYQIDGSVIDWNAESYNKQPS